MHLSFMCKSDFAKKKKKSPQRHGLVSAEQRQDLPDIWYIKHQRFEECELVRRTASRTVEAPSSAVPLDVGVQGHLMLILRQPILVLKQSTVLNLYFSFRFSADHSSKQL